MSVDYAGESKDYRDNQGEMALVFGLALLVVYLVLVAQFESLLTPAVAVSYTHLDVYKRQILSPLFFIIRYVSPLLILVVMLKGLGLF